MPEICNIYISFDEYDEEDQKILSERAQEIAEHNRKNARCEEEKK